MMMKSAFGKALREVRRAQGLTQEDFAAVSSRTYLSALERGKKSPTLNKAQNLADAVGVHLLSVLALAFLYGSENTSLDDLLERIRGEVEELMSEDKQ